MRVIDLITTASQHLSEKGFDNARLEVDLLLGSILGRSRIELYMDFDRPLTEDELEAFRALYRRRLAHEPLQYVIGSTGFRDVEIKTDPRVFIPRPETELLVQTAVDFLQGKAEPLIADLGTGTGIIAVSIVYEVPGAHAVAVDISEEALLLAEQNARKAGVADSITLVQADMLDGLADRGPFDAVISNPPYIRTDDIRTLQPEVRDHEPLEALDGGPDGLAYLTVIADGVHRHIKPGGLLAMECEGDQADMVAENLENQSRYSSVVILTDLAGRKRIVKAVSSG